MSKVITIISITALLATPAFAFDWPQAETASDTFYSYFGQLRGGTIENSLIFKDSSDVKTADDGTVIALISEHGNDFGWFESTLGNAVIVAHDNQLVTVYGNLDADTIPATLPKADTVKTGTPLGASGNSGWQEGRSCLEFEVLDTKNNAAVNPRILMPRVGEELPLNVGDISLVDRDGEITYLSVARSLKAGAYYIYHDRQSVAVCYRSTVAINGAVVETLSYDMLKQNEGKVCVYGNNYYPVELVYPDKKRQLLGQIQLTRGRNTLQVALTDILGTREVISYTLEVY
jgi:murein DD-endopeptidase MepM/ murein hydrolase activator NlpD